MVALDKFIEKIGWLSEWSGKGISWVSVILVLTICYDVLMRYLFNAATNWSFTLSYMLGACMFAMGQAFVHRINGHVRIDLLYSKFSPRKKLLLDFIFTLIFFFPVFSLLSWTFWVDFYHAFRIQEKAIHSTWYPLTWPYKLVIAMGLTLLFLQGVARFIQESRILFQRRST